jgi:predicted metal-dependent hydrolase
LQSGQAIGKAHHLQLIASEAATKIATRVTGTEVFITYPATWPADDSRVQKAAQAAGYRALRKQAETLLPARLETLARLHDFTYKSIKIKRMKSRWGSCDQQQNIVLNSFLMQLPWECIDYVIMHELVHTRILQHGPKFWGAMAECVPNLARLRKSMREYHPVLHGSPLDVA